MVSIEDFAKLDIRVGRVVNVEDIERARKPVYKLTVDLGSELGHRTIVAGIKEKYSKEDLMDKRIVCIVNLEPKMVAGVESQGMILAAGEIENVSMLVPDREIEEGARIH